MNNAQKIGRLYQHFASCDWNHNNNELKIIAADNGILIEIEFDCYKEKELIVDFGYKFNDDDFTIQFRDGYILHAFTFDFEKLDELLTKIFTEVIKTPMETLSTNVKENSK